MTLTETLTQLAYRLNKTPPPSMDALTQARLTGFINQRHRRLLTKPGIRRLRDATVTVASVASQPTYTLLNIAKISRMFETTNDRTLYEMSQQDYRLIQPDTTITGTPEAYIWTGRQAVAVQPSNASALFVKSSSAADTTQTVYVEGTITGGYPQTASVTLTGTTAVNVASTVSTWESVTKWYLSAAAAGTVSLIEDSGAGTVLALIPIGKTMTFYDGFSLWPTPSGVITYYVDIVRAVTDLSNNTDVSLLPEDFSDLLILGPLADEYAHLKDERYAVAMAEATKREGELMYWLAETAMGRPVGLARQWLRPSQLGSWYPAGT